MIAVLKRREPAREIREERLRMTRIVVVLRISFEDVIQCRLNIVVRILLAANYTLYQSLSLISQLEGRTRRLETKGGGSQSVKEMLAEIENGI